MDVPRLWTLKTFRLPEFFTSFQTIQITSDNWNTICSHNRLIMTMAYPFMSNLLVKSYSMYGNPTLFQVLGEISNSSSIIIHVSIAINLHDSLGKYIMVDGGTLASDFQFLWLF